MTNEQIEKIVIERYGDDPFSFGGQRDGMREVLNNPEKYNLMPIPTDEEIEAWFTGGGKIDWQDAPYITKGDLFDTVLNAFEYFKNRNNDQKS